MASSKIAPAVVLQVSYAGFEHRVAAHLIDLVIALAVMLAGQFFNARASHAWCLGRSPSLKARQIPWHYGME